MFRGLFNELNCDVKDYNGQYINLPPVEEIEKGYRFHKRSIKILYQLLKEEQSDYNILMLGLHLYFNRSSIIGIKYIRKVYKQFDIACYLIVWNLIKYKQYDHCYKYLKQSIKHHKSKKLFKFVVQNFHRFNKESQVKICKLFENVDPDLFIYLVSIYNLIQFEDESILELGAEYKNIHCCNHLFHKGLNEGKSYLHHLKVLYDNNPQYKHIYNFHLKKESKKLCIGNL